MLVNFLLLGKREKASTGVYDDEMGFFGIGSSYIPMEQFLPASVPVGNRPRPGPRDLDVCEERENACLPGSPCEQKSESSRRLHRLRGEQRH